MSGENEPTERPAFVDDTQLWEKPLPECFRGLKFFEPDRLLPRETAYFVRAHANGHINIQSRGVDEVAKWVSLYIQ